MVDQAAKTVVYIQASGDSKFSEGHTTLKRFGVGIVLKDKQGVWWQRKGWFCGSNGDVVVLQALLELVKEHELDPIEALVSKGFLDYLRPGGHLDSARSREGKNAKGKPFEAYNEWEKWRKLTDSKRVLALPITAKVVEITDAAKLAEIAKKRLPFEFLPNEGAFCWDGEPEPYAFNRVTPEGV